MRRARFDLSGLVRKLSQGRPWLAHAFAVLLVAILALVITAVSIQQDRLRRVERTAQSVDNTAHLLEEHLADSLDKVDLALRWMAGQADRAADGNTPLARLAQDFALAAAPLNHASGIRFGAADASARVFYRSTSADAPAAGAEMADPAYFNPARQEQSGTLVLAGPLPAGGDTWNIVLARRVRLTTRLPGGAGYGVVFAEVPVERLGKLLGEIDLGPDSAITLRTTDLTLVYRRPWPEAGRTSIGSREISKQLQTAVAKRPRSGDFVARTALDGIRRINAYRQVGSYPLYVLVGMPLDDFPSGWTVQETLTVLLALCTIGITASLLAQLYRSSQREVNAAQRRYEAIVRSSRDAIISKNLNGTVMSWNPAATEMFGYSATEMIGHSLLRLIPPERRDEERDILARIRRNESIEPFETVRVRKNGMLIDVSVSISPVHDAGGRVIGASNIARDISRQKAAEEAIRRLAYRDTLTGLANRRLLLDRLRHAVAMSQRSHAYGVVLFIDLDKFKLLNDTYGHEAGDALLVAVADRLKGAVRESDTVARYGGDEFVVLCENLSPLADEAWLRAQALVQKVGDALQADFPLGPVVHRGGASVGFHVFRGDGEDIDNLLKAADASMYRAKSLRREALQQPDTNWGGLDSTR